MLDLLLEFNELELLLLLLEFNELELLLLLLELNELELLFLLLELNELELLDLLLELNKLELLLLLLDKEDELLLLLLDEDKDRELFEDVTALFCALDIDEFAETIALLVWPPVATDLLEELSALTLLFEFELLEKTLELLALLVEELAGVDDEAGTVVSLAATTGVDTVVPGELAAALVAGGLFVLVSVKPDVFELPPPAPPPQALNIKMMLSESVFMIIEGCIFIFMAKAPINYLLSC